MAKFRRPPLDLNRLCEAMRRSRLALQNYRDERREAVRQYIGRHWSTESTREQVPINLLQLYVRIVGRSLFAKNPRVMLSTFNKQAQPMVATEQAWCNQQIGKMGFENTIKRTVLDALFMVGINHVALTTPAAAAVAGWNMAAGTPGVWRVDLDDFVFDMHARDFESAGYMGHRYRVPLEAVKDSRLYSRARKDLQPTYDSPYNLEGDERLSTLGRTYYSVQADEFEDHIDLWDVYIPRRKVVITLSADEIVGARPGDDLKPLREVEWVGPDTGPYHFLGYNWVPDNAMPQGPVMYLKDLHDAVNNIFRKLIRQAQRMKGNTFVQGNAEDGERLRTANDGDIIPVNAPDKIEVRDSGGPNQSIFLLGQELIQRLSWIAGNLDMMGGLSPQSKTLGQDELLAGNASAGLSDMQDTTTGHVTGVLKSLLWYYHKNPHLVMTDNYSPPGLPEISVPRHVTPQQRNQLHFDQLDMRIDPYSMQHQTPQQRVQALTQIVTQLVQPMMPLLQQQGIMLDLHALLNKIAGYMDLPDIADILSIQTPPPPTAAAGQGPAPGAALPPTTTRNYNRRSLGSEQGQQGGDLMNQLRKGMGQTNGQPMNPNGSGR